MQVEYGTVGWDLTIKLIGELDECAANRIRARLDSLLERESPKRVIFELSGLSFADSTGIGMLLGRYKLLKQRGVPVYISNPTRQVERIFEMSGIFRVMPKIAL